MKDREFSVEDAYQIFVFFMPEFWWNFLKEVMFEKGLITKDMTPEEHEKLSEEDKKKDDINNANNLVFNVVPCDPNGCGDYLEDIIEDRMHIPPKQQHEGLRIKEDMLFQLVIDFCNYFMKTFQSYPKTSLNFAVDWLKDMRKYPEDHKKEWGIWNEAIFDVTERNQNCSSSFTSHIGSGEENIL